MAVTGPPVTGNNALYFPLPGAQHTLAGTGPLRVDKLVIATADRFGYFTSPEFSVTANSLKADSTMTFKFSLNTTSFSASCEDRKSTRLNSSHVAISYAVFCLKK